MERFKLKYWTLYSGDLTMPKITKDMLIMEVISRYPETAEIMLELGLHCVGCFLAQQETIEQGALAHGMSPEQIDEMIERLNKLVEEKEKNEQ